MCAMEDTLLALKVKAKWLRLMRGRCEEALQVRKTVEVRRYRPSERTPPGQAPLRSGDRFFLLAAGEVWGSACLDDVTEYTDMDSFQAAAGRHCVTERACRRGREVLAICNAFRHGRKVYGWNLTALRWFREDARPRSGADGVPAFKGQACGWVWSRRPLPASLDALTV